MWLLLPCCRGTQKDSRQKQPAPYPGAWVESDGSQLVPQGFPFYLALACIISVVFPSLVLAYCLLKDDPVLKALGCATLAPYLLVFLPQILLETKYLNRSFMTPALPVLYAYYRFWQFVRSIGLVASVGAVAQITQGPTAAAGGAYSWLLYYLLSLLCFWAFDTGCTMVWLPGMYEWQLQDVGLLTRLSQQRRQQEKKAQNSNKAALANGAAEAEGHVSGPALAAKLRHRWRLAGSKRPAGSGDFDSYSFGT